jgi:hypothetical protein
MNGKRPQSTNPAPTRNIPHFFYRWINAAVTTYSPTINTANTTSRTRILSKADNVSPNSPSKRRIGLEIFATSAFSLDADAAR